MLSNAQSLATLLGVPQGDTSQTLKLNLCLQAADSAVKNYCKKAFELGVYTNYPTRLGGRYISLPETPVFCYPLTGTLTSGSPTVTGISSTSNLLVGMPALVAVASNTPNFGTIIPSGTTIASVDTASQVTLSQNATAAFTGLICFGLSVLYSPQGAYGDGPGGFPAQTQLYLGLDYALRRDRSNGSSASGVLERLRGAFMGVGFGWGFGMNYGMGLGRGTLTAPMEPYWPKEPPGGIQVTYTAGYNTANGPANTVPNDLALAVLQLAAWVFQNGERGGLQETSTSYEDYSVNVGYLLKTQDDLGTIRQLLSRYRRVAI